MNLQFWWCTVELLNTCLVHWGVLSAAFSPAGKLDLIILMKLLLGFHQFHAIGIICSASFGYKSMNLTKFFLAVPTQVFSLYTASRTSVGTTSYMLTRLTHIQLSKIFYLSFMLLNSFIKIVFQATLLKFKQYLLYELLSERQQGNPSFCLCPDYRRLALLCINSH
jgi:hypothetical protein